MLSVFYGDENNNKNNKTLLCVPHARGQRFKPEGKLLDTKLQRPPFLISRAGKTFSQHKGSEVLIKRTWRCVLLVNISPGVRAPKWEEPLLQLSEQANSCGPHGANFLFTLMTVFLAFRLWNVAFSQGQKFKLSPQRKERVPVVGRCLSGNNRGLYLQGVHESSACAHTVCTELTFLCFPWICQTLPPVIA